MKVLVCTESVDKRMDTEVEMWEGQEKSREQPKRRESRESKRLEQDKSRE